jgi:hypothetical protein
VSVWLPTRGLPACDGPFGVVGQLSDPVQPMAPGGVPGLHTPSLSESTWATAQPLASTAAPEAVPGQLSHESPTPSPSASACDRLAVFGQLSVPLQPGGGPLEGAPAVQKPSPSGSTCASEQPRPSTVAAGAVPGQLSQELPTPSPSESACVELKTLGQLSDPRQFAGPVEGAPGSQMPSAS